MPAFIAGLDLGQAADYTALVIAEKHPSAASCYHVRHLERFKLGTSYPKIVTRVTALLDEPFLRACPLVVDGTGCGRPVVDLFRGLGRRLVPVTITAGQTVTEAEGGYLGVPKRDLVGTVQVLLQNQRLRFAAELGEVQALVKELLAFEVKLTESGHDQYGCWREGVHDDLMLALALALWHSERNHRDLSAFRGLAGGFGVSGWQPQPSLTGHQVRTNGGPWESHPRPFKDVGDLFRR